MREDTQDYCGGDSGNRAFDLKKYFLSKKGEQTMNELENLTSFKSEVESLLTKWYCNAVRAKQLMLECNDDFPKLFEWGFNTQEAARIVESGVY